MVSLPQSHCSCEDMISRGDAKGARSKSGRMMEFQRELLWHNVEGPRVLPSWVMHLYKSV